MTAAAASGLGHCLWVVTSKPQPHAVQALDVLGLGRDMDGLIGAGLDELDTKTELVARALAVSDARPDETLMLGDRSYNVISVPENGVTAVGALWGYGTKKELQEADCRLFASSANDFMAQFAGAGRLVTAAN